jgi:hypothetical protein
MQSEKRIDALKEEQERGTELACHFNYQTHPSLVKDE